MSKQEKLISAKQIVSDMKQRVQVLLRTKDANYDIFPVVNALDNYISRIESGFYNVDPVPAIEPGKRVEHSYYGPGEVLSVGNAMAAISFDIRNGKTNVVHTSTLEVLE